MPCLAIHLAVAKKYLEKHQKENYDEFILGTIAPDIDFTNINNYIKGVTDDKSTHHFGINNQSGSLVDYMRDKVNFNLFFASNDINTSFLRAYFLHLLCDYCFLDNCGKKEVNELSFNDAVVVGTNDYDLLTPKLIKKYNLPIPSQIKDIISRKGEGNIKLLDEEAIDGFIIKMSDINFNEEKKKILQKETREI